MAIAAYFLCPSRITEKRVVLITKIEQERAEHQDDLPPPLLFSPALLY
jgi:hypothetical protein